MVVKTVPTVLGPFLTKVPDMAKTSEATVIQVSSLKVAIAVRAPFENVGSVSGILTLQ